MKYLIGTIALGISVILFSAIVFCVYQGITDSWTWFLVALGIFPTNIVSILITSSAFIAVSDW